MNNCISDNLFQSCRDELIVIIRTIMDIGDFFASEEFRNKDSNNRQFFHQVYDQTEQFLMVVKGLGEGQTTTPGMVRADWNLASALFGMSSTGDLPEETRAVVEKSGERCFYYGLLYHVYAWQSPGPGEMEKTDIDQVIINWAPLSFNAYGELRNYDDLSNYIPSRIFNYYHEREIKPRYKGWKFGYFKRIKAEAFFQRLFFAGCLFSVKAVERTAEK